MPTMPCAPWRDRTEGESRAAHFASLHPESASLFASLLEAASLAAPRFAMRFPANATAHQVACALEYARRLGFQHAEVKAMQMGTELGVLFDREVPKP
jgi:hypothetical protein